VASLIRLLSIGACMLASWCVAGVAVGADAIPGEQYCDTHPVSSISFAGNDVTRPQVMLRESVQTVGAPCSLDDIIDSVQNIMDLGLFRSVRAELQLLDEKLDVRYIVVEKFFFLALPRFSRTSDGELRAGLQLRWDNFLGRLHELRLTSEKRQEDNGQGRSGFVHSVDYDVPRFFGSDYGLAVSAGAARRQVELSQDQVLYGEALRRSNSLDVRLARWINRNEGVQGLKYFGGARIANREFSMREGDTGPFTEGLDISVVIGAENRELHLETYRRRGLVYGAGVRVGMPAIGSDFRYHRADAYVRWYQPLANGLRNINVHARLGRGADVLRGMPPGRHTGDVLTLVNVEYLSAFFAYPNWRRVLFADLGNVYLKDKVNPLDQFLRVGVGLRWKIAALTNTDLRLDAAWDADAQRFRSYVGTRLTF